MYDITKSLVDKRKNELKQNPTFSDEIYDQFYAQLLTDVADEFSRENGLPTDDFYSTVNKKAVINFCLGVYDANSK